MSTRAALLVLLAAGVSAAAVVLTGWVRLNAAKANASAAARQLTLARAEAERVLELRPAAQTVALGEQPQQDVFRCANDVLAAAGLMRTRVHSVNAAGDRALQTSAASGRRVQSVRIVLEPLALEELGAFLDVWCREHVLWTITGLELLALPGHASASGGYRVTITASAVYASDSPSPIRTGSTLP